MCNKIIVLSATTTLERSLTRSLHAAAASGSSQLLFLGALSQSLLVFLLRVVRSLIVADVGRLLLLSLLGSAFLGKLGLADSTLGICLGLFVDGANALKDVQSHHLVLNRLGADHQSQLDGPEGQTGNDHIPGLGWVNVVQSQLNFLTVLVDGVHRALLHRGDSFGSDARATLAASDGSIKHLLLLLAQHLLVLLNHSRHALLFLKVANIASQVLEARGEDKQKDDNGLEAGAMASVQVGRSTPARNAVLEEKVVAVTLAVVTKDRDDAGQTSILFLSLGALVLVRANRRRQNTLRFLKNRGDERIISSVDPKYQERAREKKAYWRVRDILRNARSISGLGVFWVTPIHE